jgi:hypothetical protein
MKIILVYILVIAAVLGIGFWLYHTSQKAADTSNLPGMAYPIVSRNHINPGTPPSIPYNSNPPTSGDHYPSPAPCGNYDTTQPDGTMIHNLEHGGIWISYKSSVDANTKAQLKDFANRFSNVIVEPRDADDSNIAVASWGYLLKLSSYDESQIIGFINAHINKGPEQIPCATM